MKEILIKMFHGFIIHEASWDSGHSVYTKTMEEAMVEACGGNEMEGQMIGCFSHWSNDIQSLAPYLGVALERDKERPLAERDQWPLFVNENVPPVPDTGKDYEWQGRDVGWVEVENSCE